MIVTRLPALVCALISVAVVGQPQTARIGPIDFFGTGNLNVAAIRAALPVNPGDHVSETDFDALKKRIFAAVERAAGHPPTDLAAICCDDGQHLLLYIGLPGANSHVVPRVPAPQGIACLPAAGVDAYDRLIAATMKAVQTGDTAEDHSRGYALSHNPEARARQLETRAYARTHASALATALRDCGRAKDRQAAALLLGYADRSPSQITALVNGARDPDGTVRNNVMRALWVIASADAKAAATIPPGPFVAMLNSTTWEDRNKGGLLLWALTERRSPALLAQLRRGALDSLVEMARWQEASHALPYRLMLGRIAGWDDRRTNRTIAAGRLDELIDAARRSESGAASVIGS